MIKLSQPNDEPLINKDRILYFLIGLGIAVQTARTSHLAYDNPDLWLAGMLGGLLALKAKRSKDA